MNNEKPVSQCHIKVLGVVSDLSRRKLALGDSAISYFSFFIFSLTNTASVTQNYIFKKGLKTVTVLKK